MEEIDKEFALKVLRELSQHKDLTLRQLSIILRKRNELLGLYDLLRMLNDLNLLKHRHKRVRLDIFEITDKGRQYLRTGGSEQQ